MEDLKKKVSTLQAQKEHWREKANKQTVPENQSGLTETDRVYLNRQTDINIEDVDELIETAIKLGKTVRETHEFMKPILKEREQNRKSNEAMETKSSRQTRTRDPQQLLENARITGQVPENEDDMRAFVQARLHSKMKK